MLKGIWIENFKSYRTGQLLPLAPLTLMIGANASGKSNAIEAFRFLSWYVGGEKLSTIQNRINDSEKIFRGDIRDLFFFKSKEFTVGADFSEFFSDLRIEITSNELNELNVKDEKLKFLKTDKYLYKIDIYPKAVVRNNAKDNDKALRIQISPKIEMNRLSGIFTRFDSNSSNLQRVKNTFQIRIDLEEKVDERIEQRLNEVRFIEEILSSTYFFDFVPSQMRNESLEDTRLRQNG